MVRVLTRGGVTETETGERVHEPGRLRRAVAYPLILLASAALWGLLLYLVRLTGLL